MSSSDSQIINVLRRKYPARGMVDLGNPADTLLATLLSARTRDEQVLKIFPAFRKKFPDFSRLAQADIRQIETSISTIGLYKAKAKAIKGLAQKIVKDYHGRVPKTFEELISLPGVGRKTANCVLSYAFGVPAVAVDTHVFRVVRRLGWSKKSDPEKV
ncbi:MAG TPA: endonuclease III, partial [Patescibacteria group bacterium]|nr:endonuclease III [Patescibacteria group bacterium]